MLWQTWTFHVPSTVWEYVHSELLRLVSHRLSLVYLVCLCAAASLLFIFFFFLFCIDSVQRCRPATAITQLMRLPLLTSRLILPVAKPSPRRPTWKMRTCFVYFDCAVVAVSASIALPLLLRSGISPLFDVFVALAQLCRHVVHLKCSSSSSKSKVALLSTFLDHLLTVPRIKL